jgi:hypothetical protein
LRSPSAQINDRAFERAHVEDDGARAGCAQPASKLDFGVAAADKPDHGHSGGYGGGNADP